LDADEGVVLVALASGQSEKHLYSQSWYRVAGLKPRLRSHIRIQRQVFREKEWYVLQDHSTGRFHRISPEAYFFTGLMDGKRTMADIWDAAALHLGDSLPTQEEIISLLSQIHRFDGLQSDLLPDMTELSERNLREKRGKLLSYLASPTSLRFPLLDPDKFLERTQVLISPLFGWFGGLFSLAIYGRMRMQS
jgi:putative peptide zinc metalloprotease protein